MTRNDVAAAQKQVDPRAWETNLVGGSGTTVQRFFEQGVRKRWLPRARAGLAWRQANHAYIVPCDIVQLTFTCGMGMYKGALVVR